MPHQYTLQDLPGSRKQLTITSFADETLKKAEGEVIHELSQQLNLKGFRPGKIPENIVRQQVEASYIQVRSYEHALPVAANEILEQEKLRIIGTPKVNYESLDPLKIVVEFDLFPALTVGDYSKIKVKVDKKTATDEEVTSAIEEIRKRMTEYKTVDRAAKMGDRIEVDFAGFTPDGVPIDNTTSKHHPVVLGSGMLIPGFEEELVGLKAGDEKEFLIPFPKDYHAKSLAGTKVKFKISAHRVEESSLPEMDEAFIEKVTGKKLPLSEWKVELKAQLQLEHDRNHARAVEESYFDQLVKMTKGELPQTMIDEEKKAVLQEIKERILYQGLSYEKYLEAAGKNEEQLLESFDEQAKDRLKLRLSLQEISEKEAIVVSDLDVEEKLNQLLSRSPDAEKSKAKKRYQPGTAEYRALEYQIKMQKTLEKILPKV